MFIDRVVLHEPPRRVLIPLPYSKVALCDYLFPGEGASESLISLQELLGLKLTESAIIKDFEGQVGKQIYGFKCIPSTFFIYVLSPFCIWFLLVFLLLVQCIFYDFLFCITAYHFTPKNFFEVQ